ncbi:MAG: VanW family protein, partial [Bacteroidota bacterium]
PGQDATVTYGVADLKFRNDTGAPLLLWADTVGKTLYMAVYGRRPPRVVWHHEILARQPARTVCRTNARLSPGTERMAQAGADGLTVRSWLTLIYPGGRTVTRNLGVDRYRPLPRLVERGPSR